MRGLRENLQEHSSTQEIACKRELKRERAQERQVGGAMPWKGLLINPNHGADFGPQPLTLMVVTIPHFSYKL